MDSDTIVKAVDGIERLLAVAEEKARGIIAPDIAHEINNARQIAGSLAIIATLESRPSDKKKFEEEYDRSVIAMERVLGELRASPVSAAARDRATAAIQVFWISRRKRIA